MLPIYVGDDRTDEDAFKVILETDALTFNRSGHEKKSQHALKELLIYCLQVLREGKRGFGILVSSAPKESNAFYSLRDPSEVFYSLE